MKNNFNVRLKSVTKLPEWTAYLPTATQEVVG